MSTNPPAIDYTARDFATIREALKLHLQNKFPTTWRDFYESSTGMALLDMMAYVFDSLSFALDYTANECFLSTARDRVSVLHHGRLVGYQLHTPIAAAVTCTVTLPAVYAEAIIIPAGTTIRSADGVDFITLVETRVEAGQQTGTIVFTQGTVCSDTFTGTGAAYQSFAMLSSPVVWDSVEVVVDGVAWTKVGSLVLGDSASEYFTVQYDENSKGTVAFGDGTCGKVPALGAQIVVNYRSGGGVQGNIPIGSISGAIAGHREGINPVVDISLGVENDEYRGSGGEEAESITHAKQWIPQWVKANSRAVTEEDYDALANVFVDPVYGAPAFAKAYLKQELPELNTVCLAVWGRDQSGNIAVPSAGLKSALSAYFNNDGVGAVKMVCTRTEVLDGSIVYLDVVVGAYVDTDYVFASVATDIGTQITALFTAMLPGDDFRISSLYNAVHDTAGVSYCIVREIAASSKHTTALGIGDDATVTFSGTIALEPGLDIIPKTVRITHEGGTEVISDDGAGNLIDYNSAVVGTIDYDTGVYSVTFATAPATDAVVEAEYRELLDYQRTGDEAVADGVTARIKGTVTYPPINPFSGGLKGIAFSDGVQTVTDDGAGNLVGDVDAGGVNTIDYDSGAYDFTFATPPESGATVRSTYCQRLRTAAQDIPIQKNAIVAQGLVVVQQI